MSQEWTWNNFFVFVKRIKKNPMNWKEKTNNQRNGLSDWQLQEKKIFKKQNQIHSWKSVL